MVQRANHTGTQTAQLLHGLWPQAQRQRGIQRVVPETGHMTPTNMGPVCPALGQPLGPPGPRINFTAQLH